MWSPSQLSWKAAIGIHSPCICFVRQSECLYINWNFKRCRAHNHFASGITNHNYLPTVKTECWTCWIPVLTHQVSSGFLLFLPHNHMRQAYDQLWCTLLSDEWPGQHFCHMNRIPWRRKSEPEQSQKECNPKKRYTFLSSLKWVGWESHNTATWHIFTMIPREWIFPKHFLLVISPYGHFKSCSANSLTCRASSPVTFHSSAAHPFCSGLACPKMLLNLSSSC